MTRVLIAEDSPSIRLLLVRRLEMAGHQVTETSDGIGALEAALDTTHENAPDIVLLDAMMPNATGPDLLNAIKAVHPGLPVLIISGMTELQASSSWEAADGMLRKPIDFEDLLSRVELLTSARPRP